MAEICAGAVKKTAILFERYQMKLYNYFIYLSGNKELSEDLVQNTFLRVLKYRNSFQESYEFKNWLFGIARNQFYSHIEKNKTSSIDSLEEVLATENEGEKRIQQTQQQQLLTQLLYHLSDNEREIIVMNKIQGITYDDIAQIMDENLNTIKARSRRALKKLQSIYTQNPA